MASSSVCRKRRRSDSEDCEDCLPISKRINKLHIQSARRSQEEGLVNADLNQVSPGEGDPNLLPWQQAQIASQNQMCPQLTNQNQACSSGTNENQPGPSGYQNNPMNGQVVCANNNVMLNGLQNNAGTQHALVNMEDLQGYDPELKEKENPYYFQANSLLYNAHVLRITRTKSFQNLNS